MIFTSLVVGLTAAGVGAVVYAINKDKHRNPDLIQSLSKQDATPALGAKLDELYARERKQTAYKRRQAYKARRPLKPRKKTMR